MRSVRIRRDSLPDHPWIYRKQVAAPEPGTRNGDPVRIVSADGMPLGAGLYNHRSQIALRVLTRETDVEIDRAFLSRRLAGPCACAARSSASTCAPTPGAW